MKILITTDLFTTNTNGVVTSVKNLWDELKARGHDVRILTISDTGHSRCEDGVYFVRSVPFKVYPDVRMPTSYRHRYIKEMINWKPDIIHSQCEFFSFQFAKYVSRKTGAPIVNTYHTLYEQYSAYVLPGKRFGRWVVKVFSRERLKHVRTVVVPTHKIEDKLRSYGLKNDISVIPSGISLEQHKKRISVEERKNRRSALNIPENAVVLMNLGRLGAEKNLDELISYFADIAREDDCVRMMIVGDGPNKKNLEHHVASLGLEDKVVFTGMVDPSEVHVYYQLGDIFVSASTSETQGLTYIEAASNGLPLVCRRDACLDDIIDEGINGFQYDTEEDFKKYIKKFVDDINFRRDAGEMSKDTVAKFDKSVFGESAEKLYETILKEKA